MGYMRSVPASTDSFLMIHRATLTATTTLRAFTSWFRAGCWRPMLIIIIGSMPIRESTIDGRRFDYLLANESMRRQLLALQVDDSLLTLYENERWKNLIDVFLFYYLHHHQLCPEDQERGRRILRTTWESIDVRRLHPVLRHKLGYMPLRFSWTLFRWQLWTYFFLRGLLGKNRGK